MISSSNTDRQIRLQDGRSLGFAEYGDPTGKPVIFFPGTPGSRRLHPPKESTIALGARVIVVERPGFGLSDFQPGRTLLDWPDDVVALADALGVERFAVMGISGGGPYAAACALKIPHRLSGVAIVSGVGPIDVQGGIKEMPRIRRAGAAVARYAPRLLEPLLWLFGNPHRNPEQFLERMRAQNSEVDQATLARPEIQEMMIGSYLEATRRGVRGFAREAVILSNPWGFHLEDITIPVHLWHGEADANVSLSAARYMAETIPTCYATFLPGEGHWLFYEHWGAILAELIA